MSTQVTIIADPAASYPTATIARLTLFTSFRGGGSNDDARAGTDPSLFLEAKRRTAVHE